MSKCTGWQWKRAVDGAEHRGLHRPVTLQPQYNLYERADFEGELQTMCIREHIGVITYFSLAAGFLTGKYRSAADFAKSARGPGIKKYLNPRGLKILDAVDAVARGCNATPAQVSLAWLMSRPGVTAPIASATNRNRLRETFLPPQTGPDAEAMATLTPAVRGPV